LKTKIDDLTWDEFDITMGAYEILKHNKVIYIEDLLEMTHEQIRNLELMDESQFQQLIEQIGIYKL
jgi:DNA-directed RNA polymerase alpha subunit